MNLSVAQYINGFVYLFGVKSVLYLSSNVVYKYNVLTDSYTQLTNCPYKPSGTSSVAIGTDIYLFGGDSSEQAKTTAYKYDTLTDTYTQLSNIPYECRDTGIATDGVDIYLFGSAQSYREDYAYKYNINNNTYTRLTDIPIDFRYGSAVYKDGFIYLFGGHSPTYCIYKYDISNDSYSKIMDISPFGQGNAILVKEDYVYLITNTLRRFDITNETILDLTSPTNDLHRSSACGIGNSIYLFGGSNYDCANKVSIYSFSTGEPTQKQGLWIQDDYEYEDVAEVDDLTNLSDSTINILKGDKYNTQLISNNVTNGLHYKFNGIYLTDDNGDILYDSPSVYYGNGTQWIDITPTAAKIAGIHADFANSQFTRIEDSENWTAGSDFDTHGAYQRYRCIVTDSGVELAKYGETGYTETGFLEEAITKDGTTYPIGTEVQVMVRQPKVYYKVDNVVLESDNVSIQSCDYLVADKPTTGFSLHPAFIMNNQEIDRLYYPAFEGTLYDSSDTTYTGGTTTSIDYAVDKLSSVKGNGSLTPRVSITRANARTLANNRGNGWSQLTIQMVELERLLMLVEYASFNHQSVLSRGVVDNSAAVTVGRVNTFNSSGTGLAGASSSTSDSFVWRWHENIYGNVHKWNDGANIINRLFYVADHNFADDTTTNYTSTGITVVSSNNYISRFGYNSNCDWEFIPTQASGNANLPIGDYCYSDSGNRVASSGGCLDSESKAGSFRVSIDDTSSTSNSYMGAALACRIID